MSMRDISLYPSIPNPPFFSYSSVPQSAFLGPPRRTKLVNNTLGKRLRSYRYSPVLIDEQRQKRVRCNTPKKYALKGHDHALSPSQPQAAQWHQNDRFVRKFDQKEFERALAVPPIVSSQIADFPFGSDSEFPIHPIFQSLTGLIPELYPSLRLATRFLFSRQTLPFFHDLITSPLTLLQPESEYYNAPLTHLAPSPYQATGLPEAERNLSLRTILSLAPHISIQISPDPRLAVRWAYTERVTPLQHSNTGLASAYNTLPQLFPTPAQLHNIIQPRVSNNPLLALNFSGTNAVINISPCFLRTLHPHTFPPRTHAQKLRCAFMLAVTLIHELAHAVYMCRFPGAPLVPDPNPPAATGPGPTPPDADPPPPHRIITLSNGKPFPHPLPRSFRSTSSAPSSAPPPRFQKAYEEHEPFYATHRKPELGHAWETTIFGGGKISALASCDAFSVGLGWQRWPGADEFYVRNHRGQIVPLCRRQGGPGHGGGGGGAPTRGAPKWETVYVVSDAWVWQWFLRAFWDSVEAEAQGLAGRGRVEKRLGARVRNYDSVDSGDEDGDGWESGCSSRMRGADGEGVVRARQPWVGREDDDEEEEEEEEEEDGEDGD